MFVIERKDWKKKFMELKDLESYAELMENCVWNERKGRCGEKLVLPRWKG